MENELLKEAVEYGRAKKWMRTRPYCPGMGSKLSQPLSPVSRAQLHVILRRTDDWKDGRAAVTQMIRMCFSVYTMLSESAHVWLSSGMGAASQTGRT